MKLHIYNHDRYEARDGYYVSIPEDSAMLAYGMMDGIWPILRPRCRSGVTTQVGLEHDIAFAAVAAAEWLAKAAGAKAVHAGEYQALAKEWQDFYEKTSERLRRLRS